MAKRRAAISYNPGSVEPIIRLWLLRVLVPLGGYRQFVHSYGFNNDTLAEVIGLGHWIDPETRDFDQKAVQAELRQLHQKAERQWYGERQSTFLSDNIDQLSNLVGLSTIDCKVLEFTVAAILDAVLSLEGAEIITESDKALAERWQKASTTARDRALAQIGEVEEAYFDVRLT